MLRSSGQRPGNFRPVPLAGAASKISSVEARAEVPSWILGITTMTHEHHDGSHSKKRFHLRSRPAEEPLTPDTPRFHVFLIDTGWNTPVSKAVRTHLPLIYQFQRQDTLYILTPQQSVEILKIAPEAIGHDPVVVVYDLHGPGKTKSHAHANYRGFRLNLGLLKNAEQALAKLQNFVRFIALNRTADCLDYEVRRELQREGFDGMVKILREASEEFL
jgi:hypothetical protein